MNVTILTVGEYPTPNGLHASQVMPFAAYLSARGVSVQWIALIPLEMRLRDAVVNKGKLLAEMRRLTSLSRINFRVSVFPITIIRAYSYVLRQALVRAAGKRLFRLLEMDESPGTRHIIHCRSYFASAVALEVRKRQANIEVSFDMRSLLPPEIPLMFPFFGRFFYGGIKVWESSLLDAVDYSFLPCERGIRILSLEGVVKPPTYVPIAGFESGEQITCAAVDLDNAVVGYVGGFGPWHSVTVLGNLFHSLSGYLPRCRFEVLTTDRVDLGKDIRVYSLPNAKIAEAIKGMLALVVPGPEMLDDHFSRLQMSVNCFSTKAAETLSLGVPLIVNESIRELSDFVVKNKCGLVFRVVGEKVCFDVESMELLSSSDFWQNMKHAAVACAHRFQRQNVYDYYLRAWQLTL